MSEEKKGGLVHFITDAWLVIFLAICFGIALAGVEIALRGRIAENQRRKAFDRIPKLVAGLAAVQTKELVLTDGSKVYQVLAKQKAENPEYKHFGWAIPATNEKGQADFDAKKALDAKLKALSATTKESTNEIFGITEQTLNCVDPTTKKTVAVNVFCILDKDKSVRGWVVPAEGPGFADVIKILVALDDEASDILDIAILKQSETPGLGDYITRAAKPFRKDYRKGLSAWKPVVVVKREAKKDSNEIQALTGATVSSESVTKIVNKIVALVRPAIKKGLE